MSLDDIAAAVIHDSSSEEEDSTLPEPACSSFTDALAGMEAVRSYLLSGDNVDEAIIINLSHMDKAIFNKKRTQKHTQKKISHFFQPQAGPSWATD